MSIYMTEEEQLEAIRKWWHKYSTITTFLLSLILLAVGGYKYWSWHQHKLQVRSSTTYERMMIEFSKKDNEAIQVYANQLIKQFPKTVYADSAHLILAKLFVQKKQYSQAMIELKKVAQYSSISTLQQIAIVRMVSILISQKSFKQALIELKTVKDQAYVPVINELKGDVYLATKNYEKARYCYQKAIKAFNAQGMNNLFLDMKMAQISAPAKPN